MNITSKEKMLPLYVHIAAEGHIVNSEVAGLVPLYIEGGVLHLRLSGAQAAGIGSAVASQIERIKEQAASVGPPRGRR